MIISKQIEIEQGNLVIKCDCTAQVIEGQLEAFEMHECDISAKSLDDVFQISQDDKNAIWAKVIERVLG